MPNIARSIDEYLRNADGNMTIEFGFVILFMVTLAVGAYDFGNLGYQKIAVTSAARAGSQFGVQDMSTAEDIDGMIEAARIDINDTAEALDIDADNYYFCPGQGEVANETILCADGTYSYFYVTVTVVDEIELMFPYPFIASPQVVASTNIMRVR